MPSCPAWRVPQLSPHQPNPTPGRLAHIPGPNRRRNHHKLPSPPPPPRAVAVSLAARAPAAPLRTRAAACVLLILEARCSEHTTFWLGPVGSGQDRTGRDQMHTRNGRLGNLAWVWYLRYLDVWIGLGWVGYVVVRRYRTQAGYG